MALFAVQFLKIFREGMPPDPPREVLPSAVALSVIEKNPTFSQNLNGSTAYVSIWLAETEVGARFNRLILRS